MTRRDLRAAIVLETARGMEEPTVADQARVYAALKQRILAAPMQHEGAGLELSLRGLTAQRLASRGTAARLSQLALVAALAGGVGYWLGLGHHATPSDVGQAVASKGVPSGEPPPTATGPIGVTSAVSDAGVGSAPRSSAHHPQPQRHKTATSLERSPLSPRSARAPRSEDHAFLEAVRLLQRADRAIQNGQAAFALVLLDEVDKRFPPEILNEERISLRVLASCANGDTAGAHTALSKLGAHSDSIYGQRIEHSCVAEPSLGRRGSKR